MELIAPLLNAILQSVCRAQTLFWLLVACSLALVQSQVCQSCSTFRVTKNGALNFIQTPDPSRSNCEAMAYAINVLDIAAGYLDSNYTCVGVSNGSAVVCDTYFEEEYPDVVCDTYYTSLSNTRAFIISFIGPPYNQAPYNRMLCNVEYEISDTCGCYQKLVFPPCPTSTSTALPPSPPSPPADGTSCRNIQIRTPSSPPGWYYISTSNVASLKVWCDMTTDGGAAYTIFPCENCVSVSKTTDRNGCADYGLSMITPRTQNHWISMINFVNVTLGASVDYYFLAIPGISKPTDGLTPCNGGGSGIMTYASCSGVANSWRAIDGGPWWLRGSTDSALEASYIANCLMGMKQVNLSVVALNIVASAGGCSYFTGSQYLCSTNDDNRTNLISPPASPNPPTPSVITPSSLASISNTSSSTANLGLILGVSLGGAFLLVFILSVFLYRRYFLRKSYLNDLGSKSEAQIDPESPNESQVPHSIERVSTPSPTSPNLTPDLVSLDLSSHSAGSINPNELVIGDVCGSGSYGVVFKGRWRGIDVAVKKCHSQTSSSKIIQDFKDEIAIISSLSHPNIVQFLGYIIEPSKLIFITEFFPCGSLSKILHGSSPADQSRRSAITPSIRLNMALDICRGMNYLHSCSPVIVHRDLKTANLLVESSCKVKASD